MTRDKKGYKAQRKRDRKRRALAQKQRRRLRAMKDDGSLASDEAHDPIPTEPLSFVSEETPAPTFSEMTETQPPPVMPEDPERDAWWEQVMSCPVPESYEMLRQKLSEEVLDDQSAEEYVDFILSSESQCSAEDFIGFVEEIRRNHPEVYKSGFHWFMRSRIGHYLTSGQMEKVDAVVFEDAPMLRDIDEVFFGTISMVRLAGRTNAAEALAAAGLRCRDASDLMPWAENEITHWAMDTHLRACAAAGATPRAIEEMEAKFAEMEVVDKSAEMAALRRDIVSRLARTRSVQWQRNQLTGTKDKSRRNRYLLSYDYAGWMMGERSIPAIAATELRLLLVGTFGRHGLTIKDYFDGLSYNKVDRHLASHLGFMGINRFHAPATLISMKHFVDFLHEIDLVTQSSRTKSAQVISSLRLMLEDVLKDEWQTFRFLDPLWTEQ